VSVRLTVANLETLVAAATRRALRLGETEVAPRVSDLDALIASTAGKVEVESLEEGRDGEVIDHLLRGAVLTVFKEHFSPESIRQVVDAFDGELTMSAGDDLPVSAYLDALQSTAALAAPVAGLVGDLDSAAVRASAVELLLEGLHLSKRLNKDSVGGRASYRARA
jgi:magnesium chelatase subunit I